MRKLEAMCSCCTKTKALAHEKGMVEKTLRGWVGFTNWGGGVFLFVGGTALKGGR